METEKGKEGGKEKTGKEIGREGERKKRKTENRSNTEIKFERLIKIRKEYQRKVQAS